VNQEDWYEVEEVPSWLETPSTTIPASLLTITRPQLLLAPNDVYSRHSLSSPEEIRKCSTKSGSKHLAMAEE
jgi:hypothetical protein